MSLRFFPERDALYLWGKKAHNRQSSEWALQDGKKCWSGPARWAPLSNPRSFMRRKHTLFCHLHLRHLADAFMLSDSEPAAEWVHEYVCRRECRNKGKQTHFHHKAPTDGLEYTHTDLIQQWGRITQWLLHSSLQANEMLQRCAKGGAILLKMCWFVFYFMIGAVKKKNILKTKTAKIFLYRELAKQIVQNA